MPEKFLTSYLEKTSCILKRSTPFAAAVAVFLISTLYCSPSVAAERIALVVGNQSYPTAPLANPVNDADAVGRLLNSMGYSTTIVKDATRQILEKALDNFSVEAEQSDFALVFYAGHAIQVNGKNYIIPVDAKLEKRRDINKLISLDEVTAELSLARSLGVAIIDACRDNPFAHNLNKELGRSIASRGLASIKVRGGKLLIAYATEADNVAADGIGKHSPYTSALLNHIGDPETDVRLMFGRVHDEVIASTNGQQSPNIYGSLGGRRYILNAGKQRPITESDIQQINNRFNELVTSIEAKDRTSIERLAQPSQNWSLYLDYILDSFESVELELSEPEIETDENGMVAISTLTIKELRSANGNFSRPSQQMRSVQLSSQRIDNNWTSIRW